MLSRRTRFFALVAFLTAALVPGAAVYVPAAHACLLLQPETPEQLVPDSQVIVVGTVVSRDGRNLVFRPEAFLKGPASADEMRFTGEEDTCTPAPLNAGDRALIYVFDAAAPRYPYQTEAFVLKDGHATMADDVRTEVEVVAAIRAVTGQYAVPATSSSEGAGIDWGHTIIPLGAALAIIFVIGLVLMRVWHRIDPS